MNKKELINKVKESLESIGCPENTLDYQKEGIYLSEDETFLGSLKWLPEDNLHRMIDCDISMCKSFDEAYQLFGKRGALRFDPYVVYSEERGNPSLCIRRNRFMHMFRGYRFQVSGTIAGIGDYGSSAYNMTFLTRPGYGDNLISKGLISYMLWWAAMIDAGFAFKNFYELFKKDKSILDDFIGKSMAHWRVGRDQHWSDLEPYITVSNDHIDTCNRNMYHVYSEHTGVIAYLAIGRKTVQVEIADHLLTITIPDLNDVGYDMTNEDDIDAFESQITILENNHYLEMIAVMALNLCGIHISFINWYHTFRKVRPMRKLNVPGVKNVESLNGIYKCEPDEF